MITAITCEADEITETHARLVCQVVITDNEEVYCGAQVWISPGLAETIWFNPPYPSAFRKPITLSMTYSVYALNLKPDQVYYYRALAYNPPDYYYGSTLQLRTKAHMTKIQPKIGQGHRYVNAAKAIREISNLTLGQVFIDGEGKVVYMRQ